MRDTVIGDNRTVRLVKNTRDIMFCELHMNVTDFNSTFRWHAA